MDKHSLYAQDPWRLFRILSEFVEGFETMAPLHPSVAFFGSSKVKVKYSHYYAIAEKLAKNLSEKGFSIVTGGSYGIMEAANKGAIEGKGKSCGLCIELADEPPNPYIDPKFLLSFHYFFVRKVMFLKYAQAFVVFPGGLGTLDELFEALTLFQTEKSKRFPVYLFGSDYWQGLIDWLKKSAVSQGYIQKEHLELFQLTDDPDVILHGIEDHYKKSSKV
ncbi:MAG: TIGR00730 family Rossman fold protein [Chlamydiota bacterium]